MCISRFCSNIVPVLFILPAQPVFAQNTPSEQDRAGVMVTLRGTEIPLADAAYNFYLVATRNSSPLSPMLSRLQLGEAEYQALIAHMRATIDASSAFEAAQQQELCARRKELTTMQKLGEALDARDKQKVARRAQLMQGVDKVLGAAGKARLDALVEEFRASLVTTGIDPVKAAALPGQDPLAILASTCGDPVSATR